MNLNNKKTYLLGLYFIFSFSLGSFSQNLTLELSSKKNIENPYLSTIKYNKIHIDTLSLNKELNRIVYFIKSNGYFFSNLDSVSINKELYTAFFSLNEKVDSVVISYKKLPKEIKNKLDLKKSNLKLPVNKVEFVLNNISENLENDGNSFSRVNLGEFKIKDNILYCNLIIAISKKRKVNRLIFKGYEDFPSSFKKNYFNINNETIFNQQKLKEISNLSKGLNFITEIKPPETLFTKDSTYIYLYLKKESKNSFDGLVNFSSQENGKIEFNGYLDLKLKNLLNTGESFNLLWNNFGDERQEFLISTEIPYIFNSKLSPKIDFSIYKQDSTFLNTRFNSKILYQIKNNSSLYLSFNSENSEKLQNSSLSDIEAFNSFFIGLGYQIRIPKDNFFKNKFFFEVNPSYGKRESNNNSFNQIRIESEISYLFDLNSRSKISLRNTSGLLNSENYISNELFRIGGNKSIRGFKQQSIFVKNYSVQNIEYRYLTSNKSYLYSITDLALVSISEKKEKLLGVGLGYLFNTNNSQINISTTIGASNSMIFSVKNTQFFINWINYF